MAAPKMLSQLRAHGLTLQLEGDLLRVSPAHRLTDALRAAIKAEKAKLLMALRNEAGETVVAAPHYVACRLRLQRWGWPIADAERICGQLVSRDVAGDARVVCIECRHYWPNRCRAPERAGLSSSEVGRDLATVPQHCGGFTRRE